MSAPPTISPRGRYVEVCAGAGGWGLGLHAAGWTGTGIELDADASETHRRHVGPCLTADITVASAPHPADLVCGGVPCQSFSTAGKRAGLNDDRGQLFRALLRLAGEAGARCVALENVRGLISCGALPVILSAFRAAGYEPVHALLNACDFGVPQNRVRLFIAGFRDAADLARFRWPQPTHGASGNLYGLPAWRTVRSALGLMGDVVQVRDSGPNSPQATTAPRSVDDVAYCLTAHGSGRAPGGLRLSRLDRPAPCLTSSEGKSALAFGSQGAVTSPRRAGDRLNPELPYERLTVRDCARLQSFPDAMEFCGDITSQFKQIGNAVAPPMGGAIARSLWAALYGGAS